MEFNQVTNSKVLQAYDSLENFEVIEGNSLSKTICVYFTSNGLYYPNTENDFLKMVTDNKFEWKNNLIGNAKKHIFLRDIFKQWYIRGVNAELNSIDRVLDFIKKETDGYNLITIGSSSGGYMAMLVGRLLNALKIYCFNGQFNIWDRIDDKNLNSNPLLFEHRLDNTLSKYFDTIPYLKMGKAPIFYFCSIESEWDRSQSKLTKSLNNFFPFYIKSDIHGIPFYKQNITKVLSSDASKLQKISSAKEISKFMFSYKLEGLAKSVKYSQSKINN